jgi:hypothetical protein
LIQTGIAVGFNPARGGKVIITGHGWEFHIGTYNGPYVVIPGAEKPVFTKRPAEKLPENTDMIVVLLSGHTNPHVENWCHMDDWRMVELEIEHRKKKAREEEERIAAHEMAHDTQIKKYFERYSSTKKNHVLFRSTATAEATAA